MPGAAPDPHAGHVMPAAPAADPHAGHVMPQAAVDAHAGHAMPAGPSGTALPVGDAPAPPAVPATYADRVWGAAAMAASRGHLAHHHGGQSFAQLIVDRAEARIHDGRDGYAWDGEFWYGGDLNRIVAKSEGEGSFGGGAYADVQLLWSRAIDPYFDLQAGIRQDIARGPSRTHLVVGVEGLAPYWIEVEAVAFLSHKGEVSAKIETHYDQRITQALILQPRAEIALAAQDSPAIGVGAGLTKVEAGLRLRYEITREFAPYVGLAWERKLGRTARYARSAGDDIGSASFVAGVRFWF